MLIWETVSVTDASPAVAADDDAALAAATARVPLWRVSTTAAPEAVNGGDWVAVERPLLIRAGAGGEALTVTTTMRTPGHDGELAVGFLWAEGVLARAGDVVEVASQLGSDEAEPDVVTVGLTAEAAGRLAGVARTSLTTSACGVCGRDDILALLAKLRKPTDRPPLALDADLLRALPTRLRRAQRAFARTGGLHAAGLFDAAGILVAAREDVGRHNALDKLLGALVRRGIDVRGGFAVVTSRASYEMVQKAATLGVGLLAAISAPTALAIQLATQARLTLVGFARGDSHVVYAHAGRIRGAEDVRA